VAEVAVPATTGADVLSYKSWLPLYNKVRRWHPLGKPEQVKIYDFIDPVEIRIQILKLSVAIGLPRRQSQQASSADA